MLPKFIGEGPMSLRLTVLKIIFFHKKWNFQREITDTKGHLIPSILCLKCRPWHTAHFVLYSFKVVIGVADLHWKMYKTHLRGITPTMYLDF